MSYQPIYFSRLEFACKDNCGLDNVSDDLLKLLDRMREILGVPIIVTSGCRCPAHNKKVGGMGDSAHLSGLAADLRSAASLWDLHDAAVRAGFKRIGVMVGGIHVDIDPNKPSPSLWGYGNG